MENPEKENEVLDMIDNFYFKTKEERERFKDLVREDLEVRIGEEISRGMSDEELRVFDGLSEPSECAEWLHSHCPGFTDTVERVIAEVRSELIRYKDGIPGLIDVLPEGFRELEIRTIGLSENACTMLESSCIFTVGQLLDFGGLASFGKSREIEIRRCLTETARIEFGHELVLDPKR